MNFTKKQQHLLIRILNQIEQHHIQTTTDGLYQVKFYMTDGELKDASVILEDVRTNYLVNV